MRTPVEIESEILQLKAVKPQVPQRTIFGEDNHAEIDAYIEVLEEQLSEDKIFARFEPNEEPDDCLTDESRSEGILESALQASRWREGEGEPLSKDWRETAGITEIPTEKAEKAIGIPAADWGGRCHEIADAILKTKLEFVKGGTLHYGNWLGPIHSESIFAGRPICHHGWIQKMEGTKTLIIDPTRWAFEGRKPYIFMGPQDFYDDGGQEAQAHRVGKAPEPEGGKKFAPPLDIHAVNLLKKEGLSPQKKLAENQICHLANLPPKFFPMEEIRAIHQWLTAIGRAGLIPLDFQRITETSP